MKNTMALFSVALLAYSAQPVLAADQLLYEPRPVEAGQVAPKPGEGVLVERITIKRGDTLGKISRRYSGHRSYFPQILLFNQIRNPDRIYVGNSLLVPVKPGASTETSASTSRKEQTPTESQARPSKHSTRQAGRANGNGTKARSETKAQNLFEESVSAYRRGDCRKAVKGFDRFLEAYPDSPLAADATLLRADCFLRLSR